MDGKRFDNITRGLAAGRSRRTFLGGLAAAITGAVGLKTQDANAVCSPGGWYCQRNSDCCSGSCYASSRNRFRRVCTEAPACVPKTCTQLEVSCGRHPDGCNGTVDCGDDCGDCGRCDNGTCAPNSAISCGICRTCALVGPAQFDCAIDEGEDCSTGNLCHASAACDAQGQCIGVAKDCSSSSVPPCLVGACNSTSGLCESVPVAGNPTCDDGDLCTTGGTCQGGRCISTPTCQDSTCCVAGVCEPKGTVDHCGGCGIVCDGDDDEDCCGNFCQDLTQNGNCGACGVTCGSDSRCCDNDGDGVGACTVIGTTTDCLSCGASCGAGQLCCPTDGCVTPNTVNHCGTCAACPAGNFCYDDNSPDTYQCRTCLLEFEFGCSLDRPCCPIPFFTATCTAGGQCIAQ